MVAVAVAPGAPKAVVMAGVVVAILVWREAQRSWLSPVAVGPVAVAVVMVGSVQVVLAAVVVRVVARQV